MLGFECVSIQELDLVLELFPTIDKQRILLHTNFAPKTEYEYALKMGCHLTIDSLYPLEHWPELFKHQKVMVRIDPGAGRVITNMFLLAVMSLNLVLPKTM